MSAADTLLACPACEGDGFLVLSDAVDARLDVRIPCGPCGGTGLLWCAACGSAANLIQNGEARCVRCIPTEIA